MNHTTIPLAKLFPVPHPELVLRERFGLWFPDTKAAETFWKQQELASLATAVSQTEESCAAILTQLLHLAKTRRNAEGSIMPTLWCDTTPPTVVVSSCFFNLSVTEKKGLKNAKTPLLLLSESNAALGFLWQWALEQPERELRYQIL